MKSELWERLLLALVGAKLFVALLGALLGGPRHRRAGGDTILPHLVLMLPLCVYALGGLSSCSAAPETAGRRCSARFFLLLATPFSNRPLLRLPAAGPSGSGSRPWC